MTITPLSADTHEVDLTVIALVPEYRLAITRDACGHQYSVTRRTQGINLDQLNEGTRLQCVVTNRLPRILSGKIIE